MYSLTKPLFLGRLGQLVKSFARRQKQPVYSSRPNRRVLNVILVLEIVTSSNLVEQRSLSTKSVTKCVRRLYRVPYIRGKHRNLLSGTKVYTDV